MLKQYYIMWRTLYWPHMIADIKRISRDCHACCMDRVQLREKVTLLKLFPAKKPLEYVAIDILSPLTSSKGYKYILVIICRFSKLTRTVPLRLIKRVHVAKAFFGHCIMLRRSLKHPRWQWHSINIQAFQLHLRPTHDQELVHNDISSAKQRPGRAFQLHLAS